MEYDYEPLSDEDLERLEAAKTRLVSGDGSAAPATPLVESGPSIEECLIETGNCGPGFYPQATDMADVFFDLLHTAYSCLCNTPNGLPGRGFYIWDTEPPKDCCDELVGWLSDFYPYSEREGFDNGIYRRRPHPCEGVLYAAEFTLSLMRGCRPIFNNEGNNPANSAKRNYHGYNIMVDARTLQCCVQDCLTNDGIIGRESFCGSEFFLGRMKTYGDAHCTRIDLPVTIPFYDCNCAFGTNIHHEVD